MMSLCKNNKPGLLLFILSLLTSVDANAWHGRGVYGYRGGNVHSHGEGHYNGGSFYYGGGGWGWGPPNVVINVPAQRYYVPACDDVEVCDSYGQCWIERYCD